MEFCSMDARIQSIFPFSRNCSLRAASSFNACLTPSQSTPYPDRTRFETPGTLMPTIDVAGTAGRIIANIEKVVMRQTANRSRWPSRLTSAKAISCWRIVPGVAKTMFARALARSVGCTFKRLQCTPDLLPTDVTGVSVFNQKTAPSSEFRPGPVFSSNATGR